MTTRIIEDLLGARTNLSLDSGFTATRIFFADAVEGNPDAIQFQAIQNGKIPNTGTPHPTIPLILVDSIEAQSVGAKQVKLTVNYKALRNGNTLPDEESQTQITIGGSIQTVRTNKQIVREGGREVEKLIIVKYSYPVGLAPDGVDTPKEVVGTIDKQIPLIVASFSRRESEDPAQKANDFVGKLNSRRFIGGSPKLWMCTKIGGPSNDSGETYQVTYEFMRAEGGWNTDVAFTDAKTGLIPTDIEDQPLALINVRSQRTADFGDLKLGPFSSR